MLTALLNRDGLAEKWKQFERKYLRTSWVVQSYVRGGRRSAFRKKSRFWRSCENGIRRLPLVDWSIMPQRQDRQREV